MREMRCGIAAEAGRLGGVDVEPAKELDSNPKPVSETEAANREEHPPQRITKRVPPLRF